MCVERKTDRKSPIPLFNDIPNYQGNENRKRLRKMETDILNFIPKFLCAPSHQNLISFLLTIKQEFTQKRQLNEILSLLLRIAPPPNLVPAANVCTPDNRPVVDLLIGATSASVQQALPVNISAKEPVSKPPSVSDQQLHETVTHSTPTDAEALFVLDNKTIEEPPTGADEARNYVSPRRWETPHNIPSQEQQSMKTKPTKKSLQLRATEYSYKFYHERAENPYLGRRRVFTGHNMESLPSCRKHFLEVDTARIPCKLCCEEKKEHNKRRHEDEIKLQKMRIEKDKYNEKMMQIQVKHAERITGQIFSVPLSSILGTAPDCEDIRKAENSAQNRISEFQREKSQYMNRNIAANKQFSRTFQECEELESKCDNLFSFDLTFAHSSLHKSRRIGYVSSAFAL